MSILKPPVESFLHRIRAIGATVKTAHSQNAVGFKSHAKGPRPGIQRTGALSRAPKQNVDRKSTRLNSSHRCISYAVFCLKKKKRGHEEVGARSYAMGEDHDTDSLGRATR